jgi:hypothetical protein
MLVRSVVWTIVDYNDLSRTFPRTPLGSGEIPRKGSPLRETSGAAQECRGKKKHYFVDPVVESQTQKVASNYLNFYSMATSWPDYYAAIMRWMEGTFKPFATRTIAISPSWQRVFLGIPTNLLELLAPAEA